MSTNSKKEIGKRTKVTYKNLLAILERKGCQEIKLPMIDMLPFTKYIVKENCKTKIYISMKNGNAIFSTTPLATKINKQEEKQYQNIIKQ